MLERIMASDRNADGRVTRNELPQPMVRMFDRMDRNQDGAITREEAERIAQRFVPRQRRSRDNSR